MDGWTEGETDIQMNEQKERNADKMDGPTERQTDGLTNLKKEKWTDQRMNGQT
jgi:hypothetical protein